MLQHVSIEIAPDEVEALVDFWTLLGFERVESPEALGGYVTWLERSGTQIHLIHTEDGTVPVSPGAAIHVPGSAAVHLIMLGTAPGRQPARQAAAGGEPVAPVTG